MGRRPKNPWFTDDGKPILNDGLYKNSPDGDYLYDFRQQRAHHKGSTGTANESVARQHLADLRKRLKEEHFGRSVPAPLPPPEVKTLFQVWEVWDEKKTSSISKSWKRTMKGVVKNHTHEWKDLPITALDNPAISSLKDRYMSSTGQGFKRNGGHTVRRHSGGGWNKVLVALRALVGFAISEGLAPDRSFEAKGNWLKSDSKATDFLWPENVQKFLAAVDTMRKHKKGDLFCHPGIYTRVMLGVGFREGEVLNLEWDRVIWRQNTLVVADARVTDWRPKDRDKREVEMPPWLRDYLLAWWAFCKRPAHGLVLESRPGVPHVEGTTKRGIAKGAAALELVGLHPHSCRETFATTQWEIGATLDEIAEMLGHEDPDTTLKHYIRRRPKGQTKNQQLASELMGFKNPQIIPMPESSNPNKENIALKNASGSS